MLWSRIWYWIKKETIHCVPEKLMNNFCQFYVPREVELAERGRFWNRCSSVLYPETMVKALSRSWAGWLRVEGFEIVLLELLLPRPPGLQGDGGKTLGLFGGESVAGGDKAPAGTPTGLQCSSGFMYQDRDTASADNKNPLK